MKIIDNQQFVWKRPEAPAQNPAPQNKKPEEKAAPNKEDAHTTIVNFLKNKPAQFKVNSLNYFKETRNSLRRLSIIGGEEGNCPQHSFLQVKEK
jgi:hypothetical protein